MQKLALVLVICIDMSAICNSKEQQLSCDSPLFNYGIKGAVGVFFSV